MKITKSLPNRKCWKCKRPAKVYLSFPGSGFGVCLVPTHWNKRAFHSYMMATRGQMVQNEDGTLEVHLEC